MPASETVQNTFSSQALRMSHGSGGKNVIPRITSTGKGKRPVIPAKGSGKRLVIPGKGGKTFQPPQIAQHLAHLRAGGKVAAIRKKHRYRPGTVSLREIRKYQKSTDLLMPHAPVKRVIRDVGNEVANSLKFPEGPHWTRESCFCLHEALEAFGVEKLQDANLVAIYSGRVTIKPDDINLARRLAKEIA